MSAEFTAEEVLSAMDEAIFALEFLLGGDGILAKERLQKARSAYADTLSKPADSGRVGDEMSVEAMARGLHDAYRDANPDARMVPWDRQWEPTRDHWRLKARAALAAQREQITDGKAQWDEVANILGADGDNVDDVIAKARALAAQGRGDSGPGFGLTDSDVAALRDAGLKPEEIAGDPVKQQERVSELVQWFARFLSGSANPKWITSHAMELAYYIATNAGNRHIDVSEIRQDGFKSGLNVTPAQRSMLERIGVANPAPPASPAGVPDHVRFAINRCIASQEAFAERIDKVNAGDPYASLMVRNDINYLRAWLAAAPSAPEGDGGVE